MAKIRPGRLYKQIKSQSNTRREYMGGVPGSRILQFDLGDKSQDFPVAASLVAGERAAIVHNALESTRVATVRVLQKGCGAQGYHLKVRVYPHEVVRENKQASGAGADRVSQGMRASFGKNIGTAARVEAGQAILTVRCHPQHFPVVKEAFRKANMKLPIPTRIIVEKGHEAVAAVMSGALKTAKVAPMGSAEVTVESPASAEEAKAKAPAEAPAEEAAAADGEKKTEKGAGEE